LLNVTYDQFQKYQRSEELDLQQSFSDQESHSYSAQYLAQGLADDWLQCVNRSSRGVGLMVTNLTASQAQVNLVYSPPGDWAPGFSVPLQPLTVTGGNLTNSAKFPTRLGTQKLNVPLFFSREAGVTLSIVLSFPGSLTPEGGPPTFAVKIPADRSAHYLTKCVVPIGGAAAPFKTVGQGETWTAPCPNLKPGDRVTVSLHDGKFRMDTGLGYWLVLDIDAAGKLNTPARVELHPGGDWDSDKSFDRTFIVTHSVGPIDVPWDGYLPVTIKDVRSSSLGVANSTTSVSAFSGCVVVASLDDPTFSGCPPDTRAGAETANAAQR
jgi:hypothetical protein